MTEPQDINKHKDNKYHQVNVKMVIDSFESLVLLIPVTFFLYLLNLFLPSLSKIIG